MAKVLVKRLKAIGDVLLATAVLPYLKDKHPGGEIDFWTHKPEVLEGNPHINRVITNVKDLKQYGYVYDLDSAYENHPDLSIFEAYAKIVGGDVSRLKLSINLSKHGLAEAKEILEQKGLSLSENLIAIQTAGAFWVKNWHPKNFERLVCDLKNKFDVKFLLLGNKLDPTIRGAVDLRGMKSIMKAAAVMSYCKAFIGLDSALLHFAKAMHLPVVALFGHSDPTKRIIIGEKDLIIVSDISCRFCHHRQPPPAFITVCERENEVLKKIDRLFQKSIYMSSENKAFKVFRYMFKAFLVWREKGRLIAPCMDSISYSDVLERMVKWLPSVL